MLLIPKEIKSKILHPSMLLDQWIPTWDTLAYPAGVREENQRCTPGVNFINVLHAAFACPDPENAKRAVNARKRWT